MIIAIDGPAASGKGTLAKRIAAHFGFHVLDTGLLYRAVARDIERARFRLDDRWAALCAARNLNPATLDDAALRGVPAGDKASVIARIPEVRLALLQHQRDFARKPPGAVLDGRDIGTVVCPDADIKIYITATPEERARRRHLEHQARGEAATYESLLADIRSRDERDSSRAIAPLAAAEDAITIDTTALDADAVFDNALTIIASLKPC
jgi:cytidylate kinase